jgi:predicted ATPase
MIHRFRVQNFKSIADVDVELSPVTVLVGRSGTGKSHFVHAAARIRTGLECLGLRVECVDDNGVHSDGSRSLRALPAVESLDPPLTHAL